MKRHCRNTNPDRHAIPPQARALSRCPPTATVGALPSLAQPFAPRSLA